MTAINDITGDKLVSKPTTNAYSENYDRIFGKDKVIPNLAEEFKGITPEKVKEDVYSACVGKTVRLSMKDIGDVPQLYSSGIEIIIEAKDQESAKNQLDQALKFFYKYYSQLFGVVDYGIISDSTPVEKK